MAKKKAVKETFIEPDVKWKESKAKRLLYKDIVEGKVPPDATDADGRSTMHLSEIYVMHPEFAEYDYKKFSSRLSSLRAAIVKEKTAKENEKFKEPKGLMKLAAITISRWMTKPLTKSVLLQIRYVVGGRVTSQSFSL
jgi:hypothetical protein